jgi:hypothetical protein
MLSENRKSGVIAIAHTSKFLAAAMLLLLIVENLKVRR